MSTCRWLVALSLLIAVGSGTAHPFAQSPAPDTTAATAEWQINNEPIVASGLTYFPTHETRLFDAQTMVEVDVYKTVPIYADVSIAPFTLVYVPLTKSHMRTYERRPDTDQAIDYGRGRIESPTIHASGDRSARPHWLCPRPGHKQTPLAPGCDYWRARFSSRVSLSAADRGVMSLWP